MISYEKGLEELKQNPQPGIKEYLKALEYFSESVSQDSTNISARYWKSQCEFYLGRIVDALKTSNSTIDLLKNKNHSLLPNFYVTSGIIEIINGNKIDAQTHLNEAISIYKERLRKNANDYDATGNISTMMCLNGQKSKAIEFLDSIPEDEQNGEILKEMKLYVKEFELNRELNKIKARGL